MIERLLVANRGEIACRVIRTAREMGIKTVAVHSDADAGALHTRLADRSVRIGPAEPERSYLDIDAVIGAARSSGADAIHPGYGFLSESPAFARRCEQEGVVFVGPPPGVMEVAGSKTAAKELARKAGVPVIEGFDAEPGVSAKTLAARARKIGGYPLMVKAAAGGGGRGIRLAENARELARAVDVAAHEAMIGFGDPTVFVERAFTMAKHIEVQVLADSTGRVVTLGDRDCSLQRRRQKVVEEAPAPGVPQKVRDALAAHAKRIAEEMGYVNAGTVEFLTTPEGSVHFLEVNARLQVEHPVTELVYGIDLVELQLSIAAGDPLPADFPPEPEGHAIEARVCAEIPERKYAASVGTIRELRWPPGAIDDATVRIDHGVEEGDTVTEHYDSLVAKLAVHHPGTREECLATLQYALSEIRIGGITTNLDLLSCLLGPTGFASGEHHTGTVDEMADTLFAFLAIQRHAAAAVACAGLRERLAGAAQCGFRVNGEPAVRILARGRNGDEEVAMAQAGAGRIEARFAEGGATVTVESVSVRGGVFHARTDLTGEAEAATDIEETGPSRWRVHVRMNALSHDFELGSALDMVDAGGGAGGDGSLHVVSPMHGTLSAVRVEAGARVREGEEVATLEAMKMETPVVAPRDATVAEVLRKAGDRVSLGDLLVRLDGPGEG